MPAFILEDCLSSGKPCKIYCTEPRRISAMSLAQRQSLIYHISRARPELFQGYPMSCVTHRTLLAHPILWLAIQFDSKIISLAIHAWPSSLTVLRYVCWKVEVDTVGMIQRLTKSRYMDFLHFFRHILTTSKAYCCR